tara:strand:- start:94 stop:294 length:201 start_codon:yes stop_codon:yes gene_type:complete
MRETYHEREILTRVREMERKIDKLIEMLQGKNIQEEPEFPKYDGDGKPLDIHGNTWDSSFNNEENH